MSRPGGALNAQAVAVKLVVSLKRFDKEKVEGKPDGAAPVGVAAEHIAGGLAGFIGDHVRVASLFKREGLLLVGLGQGAHAVGREKLVFIQDISQKPDQTFLRRNGQEAHVGAVAVRGTPFHIGHTWEDRHASCGPRTTACARENRGGDQ